MVGRIKKYLILLIIFVSLFSFSYNSYANILSLCKKKIWTITLKAGFPVGIDVTCTTGGNYSCPLCD